MEVLLETNNPKEIIDLIESRLEDEFFSLIVYKIMKKEVQKWISSVEDVAMKEAVSEFF